MCGFAGVVTWDEKYRVTRDTLEKMSRAIAHRGPDGEGYHLTREHEPITPDTPQIGLAFRRLAILDPDPRSNQPFHIGPLTLVFNGEIYNFRELKSEISKLRPDYHWRTTGDTEVLLMAYEVWREKCVEKLNGMFAFAVWDESKKELFLARDRMGQKPLYVAQTYCAPFLPAIAFASELGGLRHLAWFDSRLNEDALGDYLRWGSIGIEATIYSWSSKVAPSLWRGFHRGAEREGGYYFSPNDISEQSRADPINQTRNLTMQAVRRQLVSDTPIGCLLSGGIDSSVIGAAMQATSDKPILTFSIGFDDARYDETEYAAAVASHLGTIHRQFTVHPKVAKDLIQLAAVFGEPFGDSSALPTHYLSREARQHVKVALGGDGGDELFGGYDRYRAMRLERYLRRVPRRLRGLLQGRVFEQLPGSHPKSVMSQVRRFLQSVDESPERRYSSYLAIFDDDLIQELVPNIECEQSYLERQFDDLLKDRDVVQAALATDRITYLPNDLLTKVDRCSMLHGLEVRSPFMDHELVQFAAGLTTDQLLKGGPKRMLREAFAKDLPDFVFKRKKMGFAVPIGEWFRGELRPMLRDSLFAANAFGRTHFNMRVVERLVEEHETQRVDHSQRLYALLMLELWWQQQGR